MKKNNKIKRLEWQQRNYNEKKYWQDRYRAKLEGECTDDHTDEWYFSYSDISDVLKSYLKKFHRESPVLDIGCGLSKIFDELSNDRFQGPFVGVDYCSTVIDQCKKMIKYKKYLYLTLNMMQKRKPCLPFDSFGIIIDKATTDGILHNQSDFSIILNMYQHISNLLAPNGIFILITIKTVDDKHWFEGCLIPALVQSIGNQHSKFVIHFHRCMTYTDGTENGPNIFVIVKYECKSYSLRVLNNRVKDDLLQMVTVKCY